ncbi:MAG: aminoglycoside phosphotransferase family protein [Propionibacteriaceae bacterium]
MTPDTFATKPVVAERARQLGEVGTAWLTELPDLIRTLERRWSIVVGPQLSDGNSAYVANARTSTGVDVVLKIPVPDGVAPRQLKTLTAAAGRGYVRVLESDPEHYALLLERLGPSVNRAGLSVDDQITTMAAMLVRAWQVPRDPTEPAFDKARSLAELTAGLWEAQARPCSERVLQRALDYADRRSAAFDPDRCVVVHGDPGPPNALQVLTPRPGAEVGYVFVDPDGFVGDPTYDLGVVLRDFCTELLAGDTVALARHYCGLLAASSGHDEAAIWEWGFMERVSTGLYARSLGLEALGRQFLAVAEALV